MRTFSYASLLPALRSLGVVGQKTSIRKDGRDWVMWSLQTSVLGVVFSL